MMTRWRLGSTAAVLAAGMAALAACGGPPGEPAATETAPAEAAAPAEMLGGGVLTPVHDGQAGSPHVRVDWAVEGANISITYGRPYLRDRTVGESVEPLEGSVWRLGADEATTLVTDRDLMLGAAHVPAGSTRSGHSPPATRPSSSSTPRPASGAPPTTRPTTSGARR